MSCFFRPTVQNPKAVGAHWHMTENPLIEKAGKLKYFRTTRWVQGAVVRAQHDRALKSWLINFTFQPGWNKPCGNVKWGFLKRRRPPCDWAKYHQESIQVPTTEHWLLKMIRLSPKEMQTWWNELSSTADKLCPLTWIRFSENDETSSECHCNDGDLCTSFFCAAAGCTLVWQYNGTDLHVDTDWLHCHRTQGYLNFSAARYPPAPQLAVSARCM